MVALKPGTDGSTYSVMPTSCSLRIFRWRAQGRRLLLLPLAPAPSSNLARFVSLGGSSAVSDISPKDLTKTHAALRVFVACTPAVGFAKNCRSIFSSSPLWLRRVLCACHQPAALVLPPQLAHRFCQRTGAFGSVQRGSWPALAWWTSAACLFPAFPEQLASSARQIRLPKHLKDPVLDFAA